MSSVNKNKAGGHSHPQKDKQSDSHQGDSRKKNEDAKTSGKDDTPAESFGKSGAKDSH